MGGKCEECLRDVKQFQIINRKTCRISFSDPRHLTQVQLRENSKQLLAANRQISVKEKTAQRRMNHTKGEVKVILWYEYYLEIACLVRSVSELLRFFSSVYVAHFQMTNSAGRAGPAGPTGCQ
jgi:hypothetical protein